MVDSNQGKDRDIPSFIQEAQYDFVKNNFFIFNKSLKTFGYFMFVRKFVESMGTECL
jgi:hypothetical protein